MNNLYRLYEDDESNAPIFYDYDIVKNIDASSNNFGQTGLVMNTTSGGAYVMYFKYNKRKNRTDELGGEWEQCEDLQIIGSLGQLIEQPSTIVAKSSKPADNTNNTSDDETSSNAAASLPVRPAPVKRVRKLEGNPKKKALINSLSNDQILAYDQANISSDDQKVIDKLSNEFQNSTGSWKMSKKLLSASHVVFTGNGKYKRKVLEAGAIAAGATVDPQVKARSGWYAYRNILVICNKSGKEVEDSTKLKLAKMRGWSIISEDAFLKLLQLQDPSIVTNVCNAMKTAMGGGE